MAEAVGPLSYVLPSWIIIALALIMHDTDF
jgi:hypothetical protein